MPDNMALNQSQNLVRGKVEPVPSRGNGLLTSAANDILSFVQQHTHCDSC